MLGIYILNLFNTLNTPKIRHYYYLQYADEETEAQSVSFLPDVKACRWKSQDTNLGSPHQSVP